VQLLLHREQVAERQLQLARLAALCLVAVDAAFEQLVFVRQVDDVSRSESFLRPSLRGVVRLANASFKVRQERAQFAGRDFLRCGSGATLCEDSLFSSVGAVATSR